MTTTRTLAVSLLALVWPLAASAGESPLVAHVRAVHAKVAPHLPSRSSDVAVIESPAAHVARAGSTLEVSTRVLAILSNDAELATVLAHVEARAGGGGTRRRGGADPTSVAARALAAAGFDARAGANAWERLAAAAPPGHDGSDLGSVTANRGRARAAQNAAARVQRRASGREGFVIGIESYRTGVLAQLEGWHHLDGSVEDATTPSTSSTSSATWLAYARSGGITGWRAEVRVDEAGHVSAEESNRPDAPRERRALTREELSELRALVAKAVAEPPRPRRPGAEQLRDGISRQLVVKSGGPDRVIDLSETRVPTADDLALVRFLEGRLPG